MIHDDFHHASEVRVQGFHDLIRRQPFGKSRKPADVRKENRELAVLAHQHGLGVGEKLLDDRLGHVLLEDVPDLLLTMLRNHRLQRKPLICL